MPGLTISPDFGYAVAVSGLTMLVSLYGASKVMSGRKLYNVNYPALYAPEGHQNAERFNCAQRAHQNTLESIAMVNILMLLNALLFPQTSAALGAVWCVGRVLYIQGYSDKGPDGRTTGAIISHLGDLPLMVMTFYSAYVMVNQ
jgi:glutathione S-transferase